MDLYGFKRKQAKNAAKMKKAQKNPFKDSKICNFLNILK